MSCFDHQQQQHDLILINQLNGTDDSNNMIQVPKLIVQPGPSPYSNRKRYDLNNNSKLNQISDSNLTNKQTSRIYLEKLSIDQQQQESIQNLNHHHQHHHQHQNQPEMQIYQFDNDSSNMNNSLNENQQVILILTEPDPEQINSLNPTSDNMFTNQIHQQHQALVQDNMNQVINCSTLANNNCNNNLNIASISNNNQLKRTKSINCSNLSKAQVQPSPIVPSLTNVEEIFQLLSQKIAKYCQILADLTNCEVFYKAQLPLNKLDSSKNEDSNKPNKRVYSSSISTSTSSSSNKRSLYWGTHQMLFEYSHDQGLKYDKSGGDSLIKINQRSISNDVTNLIEEILNAPNIQTLEESSNEASQLFNKLLSGSKNRTSIGEHQIVELRSPPIQQIINSPLSSTNNNLIQSSSEFNLINEQIDQSNQTIQQSSYMDEAKYEKADSNTHSYINNNNETFKTSSSQSDAVEIKDCCVYLSRLNDMIVDEYLQKFEQKYNFNDGNYIISDQIANECPTDDFENKSEENAPSEMNEESSYFNLNELPDDEELYSDSYRINLSKLVSSRETKNANDLLEEEDLDDDSADDERTLLEKNCLNISQNDLNENEEDFYTCELCDPNANNHSYRHLTQLKIHQLRQHENVNLQVIGPFECEKCKLNSFETRIDYLKHVLVCYFPQIYTCKTCNQEYDNYAQYLFHTRYIHTHVVYMCAICCRKYKHIKDLLDHDQLMHSKSINYCEICFEPHKSRNDLYEHYKQAHLTNESTCASSANSSRKVSIDGNQNNYLSPENSIVAQDNLTITQTIQPSTIDSSKSLNINTGELPILNEPNALTSFVLTDHSSPPEDSSTFGDKLVKVASTKSLNDNANQANWGKVQKNDLIRGLLDRKHQCKWCSLRFYTKSQLKQHENTHTNSVLFCPVCDKQFTHKDRLSGHMKCHMEPSLECKVCGKKFKRLCNLYNHELVHGLTEHAFMLCQFCGRGFRSRRDYQNHVIANHRDQLMKSDIPNNSNGVDQDKNSNELNVTRRVNSGRKSSKNQTENNQIKTTTIVLNNDQIPEQIQAAGLESLVEIEPDTYFTRTGTTVHFENLDDDNDIEIGNDDSHSNQELNRTYSQSIDSSSINLQVDNNFSKKQSRSRDSIKDKIKRFRTSLNIEVTEDEDHPTSYINNSNMTNNRVPINLVNNHYSTQMIQHQNLNLDSNSSTPGILVQLGDEALS